MTNQLPGTYVGILSPIKYSDTIADDCGGAKAMQRNAIVYRDGRFDVVTNGVGFDQVSMDNTGACVLNKQNRTVGVKAVLKDTAANKTVAVASVHWPTDHAQDGPACAVQNKDIVKNQMNASAADLKIFGGDFNVGDRDASDNYQPWYTAMNGDIGASGQWRDPIWDQCSEQTIVPLKTCLQNNATHTANSPIERFDMLFGSRNSTTSRPFTGAEHTITGQEGNAADQTGTDNPAFYSSHLSLRARIHYLATQ